jgi:polyisoprenoid-binding protein YceI
MRFAFSCILLTLSSFSGLAPAQQKTFALDPARSIVNFTLGATAHTVHGTFHFKSGEIKFDPSTGAASGQLVVDATSGQTGNDSRDRKMKREVLETDKYPQAIFTAERIEGAMAASGASTLKLHGSMLLHGQAHAMTIPLQVSIDSESTRATAEIVIPYVSWGLKNPSTFILRVSDKVTMQITAVGRLSATSAAP